MTYLGLSALFVALCTPLMLVAVLWRRPSRRWWAATGLTLASLVVLTAVFDSVMIAADLFRFDESRLVGWFVGLAPVEDFAWPVAAVLVVPAVVLLLTRDDREQQ
ncbi:lycopene cyclase domain-containing protein [Nocardioides daphniae]|uniref:Lycopene cyclase n=1 Tax=Nocardioides daphniae TaxID=402297 RepID=A0A4P7UBL6_9ACTN|nr:lycopene cyclase domain-containing protein [Nocardioides daphniae]QCC77543.1 lycopene cyclase domain-containing protein [Nocardioides daphniae]GGD30933.1 lycopene cyclase [Nocardioides daphniae]